MINNQTMTTLNEIYDTLQRKVQPYLEKFAPYLCIFKNICGVYLLWVFIHFISAHLYIRFCTPNTILGFMMSPFMAAAPHCQALRWSIYNGGNNIVSMWVTIGIWLMNYFPIFSVSLTETRETKEKDE